MPTNAEVARANRIEAGCYVRKLIATWT
jgi:hypothetical protein